MKKIKPFQLKVGDMFSEIDLEKPYWLVTKIHTVDYSKISNRFDVIRLSDSIEFKEKLFLNDYLNLFTF